MQIELFQPEAQAPTFLANMDAASARTVARTMGYTIGAPVAYAGMSERELQARGIVGVWRTYRARN